MATQEPKHTIPSAFIRLDDRVTDPDAYINARDLQVIRNNHNKLLAQGNKRHLCTIPGASLGARRYGTRPLERVDSDIVFAVPLRLSSHTQEIEVVLQAYRSSSSANCYLWFSLDTLEQAGDVDNANQDISVTATATTGAKYSVTIPVPHKAAEEQVAVLTCYLQGIVFGADTLNPGGGDATILEVGRNYIDIDTSAIGSAIPFVGEAIYISTKSYGARRTIRSATIGTDQYRLYIDAPFEGPIIPGTDTAEMREAIGVTINSASLYEKRVTDFANNPGDI